MSTQIIKKGEKMYFESLPELEQFSIDIGNPKSGYEVKSKYVFVVTKTTE